MWEDLLFRQLTTITVEFWTAFVAALTAVYFTFFFEPIQPYRESLVYWLEGRLPEKAQLLITPLYCPKCAAFWGAFAYCLTASGNPLASLRVAMLAGVIGYGLTKLTYE